MAVDKQGGLYVVDQFNKRVLKLPPGSSAVSQLPFGDPFAPHGIAVGDQGDVYVVDFHNRVLKLPAGYQPTELAH